MRGRRAGHVDCVKLTRGMGSHSVSGTGKDLYRYEHQGGPLRIFAHDLDLPLIRAVTKVLDPVYLRSFIASEASSGFMHEQSCGQVGNPVADLPHSKCVVVRRTQERRHTGPVSGRTFFLLGYAASSLGSDGADRVVSLCGSKLSRPRSLGKGYSFHVLRVKLAAVCHSSRPRSFLL